MSGQSTTTRSTSPATSSPNQITGNDGANVLSGLGGSDQLIGFGGADTFLFASSIKVGAVDQIVDFQVGIDKIGLSTGEFAGLAAGALAAGAFNTGAAATEADDRIIYNSTTGALCSMPTAPVPASPISSRRLRTAWR